MNKYGRIPSIPLSAEDREKAIKGEILVNWDGQYLMGKNPTTGEVVRLGDADSLYGIVNYIAGTNFDQVPNSFESEDMSLDVSLGTGWYASNELVINPNNENAELIVNSEYKIFKDRNYTLTFYAASNLPTIMYIKFDEDEVYPIKISKSPMSKYRLVINTSIFKRSYYERFKISFDRENDLEIKLCQFMFEYGATANPWTERTEITAAKVGDLNVNGVLSVNGVDIFTEISGGGVKGIKATSNDIVTKQDYLTAKTDDSNFDLISYKGEEGVSESIAYKSFSDLLYGTYSIMLRMKAITTKDRSQMKTPIATLNIYELAKESKLIAKSNIFISEFNGEEFEELGILVKYNGTNSKTDRTLVVEVIANGDGETTVQIDFIYLSLAYTSLLPNIIVE